jgi:hypothetical protein
MAHGYYQDGMTGVLARIGLAGLAAGLAGSLLCHRRRRKTSLPTKSLIKPFDVHYTILAAGQLDGLRPPASAVRDSIVVVQCRMAV